MRLSRRIVSSAEFALIVSACIGLHALVPSVLGREAVSAGIWRAATVALASFAFMFAAALTGRWKRDSLQVGTWFAWLVLGSLGILFAEVVVLGDIRGGIAAALIWAVVLTAVWVASRTKRCSRRGPAARAADRSRSATSAS
jgi:hypothetical protein